MILTKWSFFRRKQKAIVWGFFIVGFAFWSLSILIELSPNATDNLKYVQFLFVVGLAIALIGMTIECDRLNEIIKSYDEALVCYMNRLDMNKIDTWKRKQS